MTTYKYQSLNVSKPHNYVLHVEINRPKDMNGFYEVFLKDILDCFTKIKTDKDCRVVMLSSAGKIFFAGLDCGDIVNITQKVQTDEDAARKAKLVRGLLEPYQKAFTAIENCQKPVILAVHSSCVGGGMDLISCCDICYCTTDAKFCFKDVDFGFASDLGVLQRLPKAIGNQSFLREYVYTCDEMDSTTAKNMGMVSRIYSNKDDMIKAVKNICKKIAAKSPVAVQGSKIALNFSRDHSVREGLEFMVYWNMCMLQSEDVKKAASATITNQDPPVFSKL